MVVHPGREGVDPGAEFQTLGLDGSDQVAALSLDGSSQVAYLCLDGRILSVEPVTLGIDPGALSVNPSLSESIRESRRIPRASILVPR